MGNALCGIVPTDMVCHYEEQIQSENEKNLICLKHYTSQIVDKKLYFKNVVPRIRENENEENDKQIALSMPVRCIVEQNEKSAYSMNDHNIYVT